MHRYFVEVRPTVKRTGKPKLVPLDEIHKHTGFRSVFCYSELVKRRIEEEGSTAYMRNQPVYVDMLLVDFDNCDGAAMEAHLIAQGIGYSKHHSGGRSIHFHIDVVGVEAVWVPAACKEWVKSVDPTADISYFHSAGLFRLEGTYHYKYPGQCKRLLERREGKKLVLKAPESLAWSIPINTDKTVEDLFVVSTKRNFAGNRRPTLWLVATIALELGWDEEQVREHLLWVNNNFNIPAHDDTTVDQQLDQAIIRQSRRTA